MSRPSEIDKKPVEGKQALVDWFAKGNTRPERLLIGVEHEKPPFYLEDNKPVPYQVEKGSRAGIRNVFDAMAASKGWREETESGLPMELHRSGVNWTLEPGGQMETGGAPYRSIHANAKETDEHIREMVAVAKDMGIGLAAIGYHPTCDGKNLPDVPKSRYQMLSHYAEQANLPTMMELMKCTSTAQVNLGYTSEEDMVKKLRVSLSLQPIAVALFANSPFSKGDLSGYQSFRSHTIQNNIGGRYGYMLPIAFEEGFGFEKFTDYAMNKMPMMGVYKGNVFMDAKGGKFEDFMRGKLSILPGQRATLSDWRNHLNTIWPEVRLRQFLEMRGADNGPAEMIKALPAFWVGLLYSPKALDQAYEMVKDWTQEDREYLRTMTPLKGLQTEFMGTTVQEIAKTCLDLADQGLRERNKRNEHGQDERIYLDPLHEIAQSGMNWSQRLTEKFETVWKRDINRVFEAMNYENEPSVLNEPRAIVQPQKIVLPASKF